MCYNLRPRNRRMDEQIQIDSATPAANLWRGLFFGVLAGVTYGLNPAFALPLYARGFSPDSVLCYRYALGALLLGLGMAAMRRPFAITWREALVVAPLGILFSLSSLFLYLAYVRMNAGIASTLLFLYPLMTAVLAALCFHERLTALTAVAFALAFGGVALLAKDADGRPIDFIGVLEVVASSFSYALYLVGVQHSRLKEMSADKLTFYALIAGLFVYAVRLDGFTELKLIDSGTAALFAVLIALVPTVLSLVFTALAIHGIGATRTALLGAFEPLTAVVVSLLFFGERLTPRLACGIVLILVSAMLVIRRRPSA